MNAPDADDLRSAGMTDARQHRRILVVRTSAIGDIVFASPMAAALRRTYPRAHIAWLVESGLEPLVEHDPAVDQVLSWPRREWARLRRAHRYAALLRATRDFRAMLRAQRFDLALDLQGLLKSGLLTWLSGARLRVGLGSREGSGLLMTDVIERGGPIERISSEYLHFARRLGMDTGDFVPCLHVSPQSQQRAVEILRAERMDPGRYAVLAPFTTRPQKHWLEERWPRLAALIGKELDMPAVMLGGPADRDAARRIAADAPQLRDLVGRTSLGEAGALVRGASIVVGVDTGLTHMGIGFGRPTVALFGSTRPYLDSGRANAEVIWLGLPCSPCRRHPTCNGAFTCLRDIRPERVMQSVARVLAAGAAA